MQDRVSVIEELVVDENKLEDNKKWFNDNAKDVLNTIKDNLKVLNADGEISDKYLTLVDEMDNLDKEITSYGNQKLSLENRDSLLKAYQKVADKIVAVQKYDNQTRDELKLFDHVNKLSDFVACDIRSLIKMDKPQTIKEISENGRKKVIDISNQQIERVGAGLSDRQVILDGNEKKVFTQNKDFNLSLLIQDNIDKYCNEFPEYKDTFKKFTNGNIYYDAPYVGRISEECDNAITKEFFESNGEKYFLADKDITKIANALGKDQTFQRVMGSFLNDVYKIRNQNCFHLAVETGTGEPAAERNSGMSVVAELLGIGNVICHSEPVTIKDGDKTIEGNVMNFAYGTDINNVSMDDPVMQYKAGDLEITKEAKKAIADVQLLDYICGNLDRHAGNLFIKYDLSNPDKPKVVGVEGIDNDASFYTTDRVNPVTGYNRMVGLGGLQLIDKQTADKIKTITPAMLKLSLQGLKIGDQAIKNTIQRFKVLQLALNKNAQEISEEKEVKLSKNSGLLKEVNINIVKDEKAWDNLDLDKVFRSLPRTNKNLFKQTLSVIDGKVLLSINDRELEDLYKSKMDLVKERRESKKNIKEKTTCLNKATQPLRSSNEYRAVQKALNDLKIEETKMNFNDKPADYEKYQKALLNLKIKAEEYLAKKANEKEHGAQFKDYTKNRINQITQLKELTEKRMESYQIKVEDLKVKNDALDERNEKTDNYEMEYSQRMYAKYNEQQKKELLARQQEIREQAAKDLNGVEKPMKAKSAIEVNNLEKEKVQEVKENVRHSND